MGNNSKVYVCVTHTEAKQCGRKEWENGNWAMCWMVDLRVAIQTYESYALLFFTLFHAHIAPLHDDESNQKNANKFLHLKLCVKINGWKWIMCFSHLTSSYWAHYSSTLILDELWCRALDSLRHIESTTDILITQIYDCTWDRSIHGIKWRA